MNEQEQQQTLVFAAIGDLEVTRRQLILEVQKRDERIAELEAELAEFRTNNGKVPVA